LEHGKYILLAAFLFFYFTGCESRNGEVKSSSDSLASNSAKDSTLVVEREMEIKKVFYKQIQGLKAKNPADYFSTLRLSSQDSLLQAKSFESLMSAYDLDYTITNFKVLRSDNKSAEAEVELEVRKINGPPFEDHVSVTRHIMEKSEGNWYILESREIKHTKILPLGK
jgi:hypothetical protein